MFKKFIADIIEHDTDSYIHMYSVWERWAILNDASPKDKRIAGINRSSTHLYFKMIFGVTSNSRQIKFRDGWRSGWKGFRVKSLMSEEDENAPNDEDERIANFHKFLDAIVMKDLDRIINMQQIWEKWAANQGAPKSRRTIGGINRYLVHHLFREHFNVRERSTSLSFEKGHKPSWKGYRMKGPIHPEQSGDRINIYPPKNPPPQHDRTNNVVVAQCRSAICEGRPGSAQRRFIREQDGSWTCSHCSRRHHMSDSGKLTPAA